MTGNNLILDTNVVIDYFKHHPHVTGIINRAETIYLPVTVIGELYFGAYRSQRPEAKIKEIQEFFSTVVILEINLKTTDIYGAVKAALANKGRPIPYNDVWIAAIAIQYNLPLYTFDKDFKEVDSLQLFNPLSSI